VKHGLARPGIRFNGSSTTQKVTFISWTDSTPARLILSDTLTISVLLSPSEAVMLVLALESGALEDEVVLDETSFASP
jgi:hypothetical protein